MMAQTADHKDWYLSTFEGFEKSLNGNSASPVHGLRRTAIDRFAALGFPTSRDEAWKNVSLAALTRIPFTSPAQYDPQGVTSGQIDPFVFNGLACTQLVFVDGFYAPELSVHQPLPDGVEAGSLAAVLESNPERISEHLARYAGYEEHAFTALNTAFLKDGAFIFIPKGVALETPVHLLFVSTSKAKPTVSHPRTLVLAENNAQATVVETYAGLDGGAYFTNAVTELAAGDDTVIDHYKLELESPDAFHIANMQLTQGRNSAVSTHAFSLGGGFVRNDVSALLAGESGEATMNGFYLLEDGQHVDNYTLLEHAEPNCTSHELYKGILNGASRTLFRGKIHVHQKAQKTDAYQTNQNLLLSDAARVNTKPQLEIYADDVKCSHGATIGQLDENALFYLRSRGIERKTAHHMLLQAFADDIIDRVKIDPVRQQLGRWIGQKFERIRLAEGKK